MKPAISLLTFLFVSLTPSFCQPQSDPATKEDVEQLLEITGAHNDTQLLFTSAAQQAASMAAGLYQRKNPNATPQQIRAAQECAADSIRTLIKAFAVDELTAAMIPVYQRHHTHSDIQALLDFYKSPVGQRLLKEGPLILADSMQAVRPLLEKYISRLEAQAEAAAQVAKQPDGQSAK